MMKVLLHDEDEDHIGNNSTETLSAPIDNRNQSSGNSFDGKNNNNIADHDVPPRAPQSGHVPSPASGVRSLSDDGVNHRILSSPLLRHRHHPNRRQQSIGSNSKVKHRHQQQQLQQQNQQLQWNNLIQCSHSLDDADIAAGAAQLRAMELLSSPVPSHHQQPLGTSSSTTSAWISSPSSRSLGSHTPTRFFSRHSNSLDGVEKNGPFAQRMERRLGSGERSAQRNHYLYGGSEHDFLTLSPENDDDDDDEDRQPQLQQQEPLLQQQQQKLRVPHYPPYGLPSIEGSPDIVAINNRRQKMQLSSSSSSADINGNIVDNEDAEYFTALLPSKPPLFSSYDDSTKSHSNTAATTSTPTTYSNTAPTTTTNKFVVLGFNLTTYSRRSQFLISAGGTFLFSLIYGYLQELISVSLCNRKLGLFLALAQFTGYTILSYFFRRLDMSGGGGGTGGVAVGTSASVGGSGVGGGGGGTTFFSRKFRRLNNWGKLRGGGSSSSSDQSTSSRKSIPIELYIGLSVLRAIDLGMTNLAMQYVNYPAKTIMKSTRVVWTMLFGVIVSKKRYGVADFGIVGLMVAGLGLFMHADSHTSAVFQPIGIVMLIISLLGDGAISNLSEALMNQYEVGQDEFIFRLYSIATFFIFISAAFKGDLRDGLAYLTRPGTMKEIEDDLQPSWSILAKILTLVLFSTTGFLGSSCSAAITKSFGALTMSITSTARKATTIFLSFALFPSNKCTLEHLGGIFLFIASLVTKSIRESKRSRHHHHHSQNYQFHHHSPVKHDATVGNGVLPPVIMEIVNMSGGRRGASRKNNSSTNMGSSPLQLRHKVSGDDAV